MKREYRTIVNRIKKQIGDCLEDIVFESLPEKQVKTKITKILKSFVNEGQLFKYIVKISKKDTDNLLAGHHTFTIDK